MLIHLNHNGKELGQFSRAQVEGMIRGGIISYDTLAWAEGHTTWKPLHEIIGTPVPPLIPRSNVVPSTAMHPVKSPAPKEQAKTSGWRLFATHIMGFALGFVVCVIAHVIEDKGIFLYTNSLASRRDTTGDLLSSVAESLPIAAESLCSVIGMPMAEDIANKRIPYPGGSVIRFCYHSLTDTPQEKEQRWTLNYLQQHPEFGASGIMPNSIIQDFAEAIRGRPLSPAMIRATTPLPNLTQALSTVEITASVWWLFWLVKRGERKAMGRRSNAWRAVSDVAGVITPELPVIPPKAVWNEQPSQGASKVPLVRPLSVPPLLERPEVARMGETTEKSVSGRPPPPERSPESGNS